MLSGHVEMKDKILEWFVTGARGISSEAIACTVVGLKPRFACHPIDQHDFKRCVMFLDAVPEARKHLDKVAMLSKTWAILVENWDELETLYRSGNLSKLYSQMRRLGC